MWLYLPTGIIQGPPAQYESDASRRRHAGNDREQLCGQDRLAGLVHVYNMLSLLRTLSASASIHPPIPTPCIW